jgi:hypothetical protein
MLSFTFEVFIKYHLQKQGCTPFGQKPLGRKTLPSNNTMPLLFGRGLSG